MHSDAVPLLPSCVQPPFEAIMATISTGNALLQSMFYHMPTKSQPADSTKSIGDKGEELACTFLLERGYQLIEKNWRYFRYEIDLIVQKNNSLVFVEVKTRYSDTYGEPWEAVNRAKRQKICSSADAFIRERQLDLEPRFDIISIIKNNAHVRIQHIEDAFRPEA
jgi:putative endonuclease